jgi:hypothetical protein
MAAAHHHNVKGQIRARHAPPISALLPDTEVPEDNIENFLHPKASRQAAQGHECGAQGLSGQFRQMGGLSLGKKRSRFR